MGGLGRLSKSIWEEKMDQSWPGRAGVWATKVALGLWALSQPFGHGAGTVPGNQLQ